MASARGLRNSSLTRVRPVFEAAIRRDRTGSTWLPELLAVAPGADRLPVELVTDPGELLAASVATRRVKDPIMQRQVILAKCFESRIRPSEAFLRWCIEHPDALSWPKGQSFKPETERWRRALLFGDPPGREAAQAEARSELARLGPEGGLSPWWRFEGQTSADCLLTTDRLVLWIEGKRNDRVSPATSWYPHRSQLVRNLEAAREVAGSRASALLVISEREDPACRPEAVEETAPLAAPHLDAEDRTDLVQRYLGQITWAEACDVLSVDYGSLPDTIAELGG